MALFTSRVSRWRRMCGIILLIPVFSLVFGFSAGRLRVFKVISNSMAPTIRQGDFILVVAPRIPDPERGQIVAVRSPQNHGEELCKRVVAVPRDEVSIRNGVLYRNGRKQEYEAGVHTVGSMVPDRKPRKLGEDEFFIMGDNRGLSEDSSDPEFGPVYRQDFIGTVICIYWPPKRMKSF